MRIVLVAVLLIVLLGAGCAKPSGPRETPSANDDLPGVSVRGFVTDDALTPIVGATLALPELSRSAKTNVEGRFEFVAVPTGRITLVASAAGFESVERQLDVPDAGFLEINVTLVPVAPVDVAYHTTTPKSGRIFCGVDWRISVGGPQGPLAACGALYNTPADDVDSFAVVFDLTTSNISAVKELVFETEWVPTQTFGSGLRVYWEAYQEITPSYGFTEDLRTFIHVEGGSPLWASVDHTDILDNVTGRKPAPEFCQMDAACRFWARVFPYADTLGSSSPVDVSTYVDQEYTHYVTEFYGERAPPGFTARDA